MATNGRNAFGRPIGVWLISLFSLLIMGLTLRVYTELVTGALSLTETQHAREYFARLSVFEYLTLFGGYIAAVAGTVALLMLRNVSVVLFSVQLSLSLASAANHEWRTNPLAEIPETTTFEMVIGWLLLLVVILYARRLSKEGVLR
jgi:hypothetical protein